MGKCISKNPTSLTIALSEKDLARANHILSKFTESSEYLALKDEQRNQLCEYLAVKNPVRTPNCGGDVLVISTNNNNNNSSSTSQKTEQSVIESQSQYPKHELRHNKQQQQQQKQYQKQHQKRAVVEEDTRKNTCLHSLDHWTATNVQPKLKQHQQPKIVVNNCPDKGNDAVQNNDATAADDDVVPNASTSTVSASYNDDNKNYEDVLESLLEADDDDIGDDDVDDDKYLTIVTSSTSSCIGNHCKQQHFASDSINNWSSTSNNHCLANNNNNKNSSSNNNCNDDNNDSTDNNNYYADVPQYLAQLLFYHHTKDHQDSNAIKDEQTPTGEVDDGQQRDVKCANKFKKKLKKFKRCNSSDEMDDTKETISKGQAESKKHSKKHNAGEIQTKGTAMSFGFRKNLNTTPKKLKKLIKGENAKKKQDKCNNICNNANGADDTDAIGGGVVGHGNGGLRGVSPRTDTVIDSYNKTGTATLVNKDDNGNADLLNNIHFEKMGAAAANSMHSNANTTATTTMGTGVASAGGIGSANVRLPGVGNRFGFRGAVRPSSTDITTRSQKESNDNIENNNCSPAAGNNTKGVLVSNLKRRSKSAHAGRTASTSNESDTETGDTPRATHPKTITFNLKQNSTIEYDRRQFFEQPPQSTPMSGNLSGRSGVGFANVISTGMHNNVIHRPTARFPTVAAATAYTKFTLQTVSLPKPEFAVAISINATTPTTPASSSYVSSPSSSSSIGANIRSRDHSWSRQHPLTVAQSTTQRMDPKAAKHMTNSTRRSFSGSREISADSGIASMDMALDSSGSSRVGSTTHRSSPKRSRSRPRNLQMIMNGRHRFEVKDLEDSLSSGDSSIVEPLALPKLPTESQTVPLPLSGLIRSNTVLSRETYESRSVQNKPKETDKVDSESGHSTSRQASEEDSESVDEEKLHLDRSATEKGFKERQFKDINTCSSKTSSPGSSVISSWCNAGESLAANDFSTLSLDSSDDSNKQDNKLLEDQKENERKLSFEINDDDLVTLNSDVQMSTLSSLTEPVTLNDEIDSLPKESTNLAILEISIDRLERPKSICNNMNESKFAEMALEGSTFLLDDETSPTDSLVSSSESEGAACKQKKHKLNEELQEKDIDEISPELEMASPLSPGTPTHCSRSLSLSDCGNLIDDEIADQPALLFNQESQDGGAESGGASRKADTPTLMESLSSLRNSIHSQTNRSRSALYQAMELSLRTPLSLRKAVMERAESLDTLSPCESICSDDLMMDFDVASSMDSIDRSVSIKSRSGSDLNKLDDTEFFSELDRKGSDVMKELNTLLRSHSTKRNNDRDITAHLPARATRLLNRSRMQQHCTLNNDNDSDSTRSPLSTRRRNNTANSSRNSPASNNNGGSGSNTATSSLQRKYHKQQHQQHYRQQSHHHHQQQASSSSSSYHQHQRDTHSSSDDLMLYDKSFRNAMIQDVLQFKKQLLRLRKILQETETLNPFENDNGQLFTSCGLDSKLLDDIDLASLTSSITDDPIQELSDLRRQVVYLQGQVDDRDRTIRLQKNLIEQLEAEKHKGAPLPQFQSGMAVEMTKECVTTATQTERIRPLSIGTEGLSRSKPEYTSFTTYFPAICNGDSTTVVHQQQQNPGPQGHAANNQTRRHTIISTTLTNYNHQTSSQLNQNTITPRRASIAWEKQTASAYKPVKITLIGDPLKQWSSSGNVNGNSNATLHINEDEFKKNLINSTKQQEQQQQIQMHSQQQETQIEHNNNILLNGKNHHHPQSHPQHLQDIMKANELRAQTVAPPQHQSQQFHPHHHHHHHQRHQHNSLKPTVTIV